MNKKFFSSIAIISVVSMLILTAGCGVRINGKDYTIFKANQEVDSKGGDVASEETSGSGTVEGNNKITEKVGTGEVLTISNSAGNITVKKSDDTNLVVEVQKKIRGVSSQKIKDAFRSANLRLERDGKSLNVVLETKDGENFWDWNKHELSLLKCSVNYIVSVPEGLKEINAETGAGNIDIKDVSVMITANTGAGNIDLDNVSATGEITLETGTGNVDFDGNIEKVTTFNASTGVGNVRFKVPENTKMSLNAETGLGHLSGFFVDSDKKVNNSFNGDINGGGPEVELSTGVGNTEVEKK
ncbi:hypothetical protein Cpap_3586 [Ruminiclostridium papyrosolvens DSM 2782]|uniref:DUF4097 domain-containing protein n=1 Tax=Ruminiclostridium papyrosolvens DSM 2782 TaxID=588581 RepID=F1T9H4_9FIRM|nr:DUF4097 family beta strand repeat-containing protein [Ruminiclostridium papyrosolvens]EGD49156.1 hypothetical protein Cpap_3586 [Ruminiclostridium papyrosolvens DSM 2782]WES35635.1 DUF4097 family beta strand repeat-containing protein [Ruminiclostridium papyrosolvens DSM 2782]